MDENKEILGIESYGISDTTLEEVIFQINYFRVQKINFFSIKKIFLCLTARDENGELITPNNIDQKVKQAVSVIPNGINGINVESDRDSGVAYSQDGLSSTKSNNFY